MIVLARIDDRLIHGQVVEGWVNFLKATCILVADDVVAANSRQRAIMELAVPQGIKVAVGRVEEICEGIKIAPLLSERIILLFSNPTDVLRGLKAGLECAELNIGGMHFLPGKSKLMDVLAVDDLDRAALQEICAQGVRVSIQTVPTQRPMMLEEVFAACQMRA
jgi:PTS system mannose-specific IIB component